jgi:hypothetical protein
MTTTPTYPHLLEAAFALGRADGAFAARWEPPGSSGGSTSRGRPPDEFARYLWGGTPGTPPSGLSLNAPLWYDRGYAEGLAAERERLALRRDAAAWDLVRHLAHRTG